MLGNSFENEFFFSIDRAVFYFVFNKRAARIFRMSFRLLLTSWVANATFSNDPTRCACVFFLTRHVRFSSLQEMRVMHRSQPTVLCVPNNLLTTRQPNTLDYEAPPSPR